MSAHKIIATKPHLEKNNNDTYHKNRAHYIGIAVLIGIGLHGGINKSLPLLFLMAIKESANIYADPIPKHLERLLTIMQFICNPGATVGIKLLNHLAQQINKKSKLSNNFKPYIITLSTLIGAKLGKDLLHLMIPVIETAYLRSRSSLSFHTVRKQTEHGNLRG
jgi:hypothetical protein